MMQPSEMGREQRQRMGEQLRRTASEQRLKNERLARQLSAESVRQWQRWIEGMLALPTAGALGIASSTLYLASLIERGFEMLQQSAEAIRKGAENTFQEIERVAREAENGTARTGFNRRQETRGEARA